MMSLKSKAGCLLVGALATAGFVLWPACATPSLPPTRTHLSHLRKADFSTDKIDHSSQDEVVAKLGPPDVYLSSLHVACYKLNHLKYRTLVIFFALPVYVYRDGDGLEVAMIQYDAHDKAQRIAIRTMPFPYDEKLSQHAILEGERSTMHEEAEKWLKEPATGIEKH